MFVFEKKKQVIAWRRTIYARMLREYAPCRGYLHTYLIQNPTRKPKSHFGDDIIIIILIMGIIILIADDEPLCTVPHTRSHTNNIYNTIFKLFFPVSEIRV